MAEFRKKNPAIPAEKTPSFSPQKPRNSRRKQEKKPRHSRESGNPFLPTNSRIYLVFHKKMRGNSKINRPEWIPAFAGMTAGRAGIRRRKSDGGNAKMTAAGEIPIYIGMVKNDGGEAGNKIGDF